VDLVGRNALVEREVRGLLGSGLRLTRSGIYFDMGDPYRRRN